MQTKMVMEQTTVLLIHILDDRACSIRSIDSIIQQSAISSTLIIFTRALFYELSFRRFHLTVTQLSVSTNQTHGELFGTVLPVFRYTLATVASTSVRYPDASIY